MAYFPDLSPYEYSDGRHPNVVNVGWLCVAHPYPKGEVAPHLIAKLKKLSKHPVELYRGFHVCDVCAKDRSHTLHPEMLSNGEIRITVRTLADGTKLHAASEPPLVPKEIESGLVLIQTITYAAPILIVHYIEAHNYLPPVEFLRALEAIPE